MTDHWIIFPYGRKNVYDLESINDPNNKFKLLYSDSEVVPAWTPGKWPDNFGAKFKIIAVTDQKIKMVVK